MLEAFSVGVRIKLIDSATIGLAGLSRHFARLNGQSKELEGRLTSIQRRMLAGGLAIGAGVGILAALKPALDQAKEFQTEVAKFSLFGMGDAANRDAVRFVKATDVAGTSYVDMMRRMTEAQGVFRDSAELTLQQQLAASKMAAPVMAKIAYVANSLDGSHAGSETASSLAMLRFIEQRGGLQSPQRFNAIAEAGFKAIRSSGGNVSWEALRQFVAHAGSSATGLSDTVLMGKFEPLIGELKSRAGVAWATAYSRLEGAVKPPNQVVHSFVDMGIWDRSKIEFNKMGGVKRFLPGAGGMPGNPLIDSQLWSSDPFAAYDKYVAARYDRFKLSPEERNRDNLIMFGRTGGQLFNLYERQRAVVGRSVGVQAQTLGIDASVAAAGGTLAGKQVELHARFKNLLEQMGESVLPLAIQGMSALIPIFKGLSAWATAHPRQMDLAVKGLVALGVALIGIGALVVGSGVISAISLIAPAIGVAFGVVETGLAALAFVIGAPVWLTVVGVVAAVAAVGTALYQIIKHWNTSKSFFWNVRHEFGMFFDWAVGWAKKFADWVKGLPVVQKLGEAARAQQRAFPGGPLMGAGGKVGGDPKSFFGPPKRDPMSIAVPPKPTTPMKVADVHLDGRKVGQMILRAQRSDGDLAARSSPGMFTGSMIPALPGGGYTA